MNEKAVASPADVEAARQRALPAFRRAFDAVGPDDMKAGRMWRKALPDFADRLGVTPSALVRQLEDSAEPAPASAEETEAAEPDPYRDVGGEG